MAEFSEVALPETLQNMYVEFSLKALENDSFKILTEDIIKIKKLIDAYIAAKLTFYKVDFNYVNKNINDLDEIWRNSKVIINETLHCYRSQVGVSDKFNDFFKLYEKFVKNQEKFFDTTRNSILIYKQKNPEFNITKSCVNEDKMKHLLEKFSNIGLCKNKKNDMINEIGENNTNALLKIIDNHLKDNEQQKQIEQKQQEQKQIEKIIPKPKEKKIDPELLFQNPPRVLCRMKYQKT